jgi:hypothetical protein
LRGRSCGTDLRLEDAPVCAGYSAGSCRLGPALPLWAELFVRLPGYPDDFVATGLNVELFGISPHYGRQPGAAGRPG